MKMDRSPTRDRVPHILVHTDQDGEDNQQNNGVPRAQSICKVIVVLATCFRRSSDQTCQLVHLHQQQNFKTFASLFFINCIIKDFNVVKCSESTFRHLERVMGVLLPVGFVGVKLQATHKIHTYERMHEYCTF